MLLVSPAEPPKLRALLAPLIATSDAQLSTLCETKGVDFLWFNNEQWWGVQRKEISDFVASKLDGRWSREVGQMKASIAMPLLVIEGKIRFTDDGKLLYNSWGQEVTRPMWRGMLWSLNLHGVYTHFTLDMQDTVMFIQQFKSWTSKDHDLKRPGPAKSEWGTVDNEDYQMHLLQGLPGVGAGLARKIVEKFGRVPWMWQCTLEELMEIDGVGLKKAQMIMRGLG